MIPGDLAPGRAALASPPVDVSKLTRGEKVIALSGIALFATAFLPWFEDSISYIDGLPPYRGWDVGVLWGILPVFLAVASAAAVLVHKLGDTELPELPVPWPRAHLIAAATSAGLVVLKLLIGERSFTRSWGLLLAAVAALAYLAGAWMADQEARTKTPTS